MRAHAIVIGSGFGGLAAAVRLGARGYRVTVLEKLEAPGGRAGTFHRDGFTFDAGPTIITAPFLFEELWSLCGRRLADEVQLRSLSPFYRIMFPDGEHFDCSADAAQMRREVLRHAPRDLSGYLRLIALSESIYRVGFEQLGDVPFGSWREMVRILPAILRLKGYRSVHGLVASLVRSEKLRQVLSFHPLLIGGNPFTTTAIYALIMHLERRWGVHYVMGGTGRLVRGLVGLIEAQGGQLRCQAPVAAIRLRGPRACGVRLQGGEEIDADVIVSNADAATTYRDLIDPAARPRWSNARIERASYSMSLFVWYFGTRRRYDSVPHHTILLGARYRGLLEDIFRHKRLAADFSLYLHRPTATDASMAPAGCDAFYVLSPVPNQQSGIDWRQAAEPYRRAIAAHLAATVLPDLEAQIVTSQVTTPLDFEQRLGSFRGAAFAMEPLFTQSAWFRPHNRSEDIERLYLVGAGTHPGAGVPGVLSSARVLDRLIPHAATLA